MPETRSLREEIRELDPDEVEFAMQDLAAMSLSQLRNIAEQMEIEFTKKTSDVRLVWLILGVMLEDED